MSQRVRAAAVIAVLAAALLVVAAVVLFSAQRDARRATLERFAVRAHFPAQVGAKVVTESIRSLGRDYALALPRARAGLTDGVLGAAAAHLTPGSPYAIAYDPGGGLLAAAPPSARRLAGEVPRQLIAAAARGSGRITDVVGHGARGCPCVDYLIPVANRAGQVVVRSPNVLPAVDAFLRDILASAPTVPGGTAQILDAGGRILASNLPRPRLGEGAEGAVLEAARRGGRGRLRAGAARRYAVERVPGSDWRVIVTAPESELLGASSGLNLVGPWLIFAALVATALAAGRLWRRLARTTRGLTEREVRYRSLVEQFPAVVYVAELGQPGRWRYVSPEIEPVLGYSVREWLADAGLWRARLHPEDRALALRAEAQAREQGLLRCTYRVRAKDGAIVWIRDEATVLHEAGGDVLQGMMYNVTEVRSAERTAQAFVAALQERVDERTLELEDSRVETLTRLALAAEFHDDATHEHTQRVGRTASLIAREIGLDDEQVAAISRAAPLHDIGKLGVSDAILLKPGRLTASEFATVKGHVESGARLLAGSRFAVLQQAEEIALSHHERWDGAGYPRGLAGEEIQLPGRIVAVADVFDALTHERPYKPAWSVERAVAEIRAGAGTQFDPGVVEAFLPLDHAALAGRIEPDAAPRGQPGEPAAARYGARADGLPRSGSAPASQGLSRPAS